MRIAPTIILAVLLALVVSASAYAQPQPSPAPPAPAPEPASVTAAAPNPATWQFGIQPRLGVVVPTSKLGATVLGGLELDYALSALEHRLVLGLDVSLARPSHDGTVMDPRITPMTADYTVHETELSLALLASYRLTGQGSSFVPWIGIGPMLHLLKTTETATLAPGENTATSTEIGVELGGGADLRAGPGFVTGDVRVAYSQLDHVLTGSTNAGKITLAAGYRVVF
jgi:hypothetical protein